MKYHHIRKLPRRLEPRYFFTFFIRAGIAPRGHDNTHRRPLVPLKVYTIQTAFANRNHHLQQIRFQPHQNRLCLRVAKPHIKLKSPRPALCNHYTRIQNTPVRSPVTVHPVNRRHKYLFYYLVHQIFGHNWRRTVSAHPSCIRPGIAVADWLMVLRRLHNVDVAAVNKSKYRRLLSQQFILDY